MPALLAGTACQPRMRSLRSTGHPAETNGERRKLRANNGQAAATTDVHSRNPQPIDPMDVDRGSAGGEGDLETSLVHGLRDGLVVGPARIGERRQPAASLALEVVPRGGDLLVELRDDRVDERQSIFVRHALDSIAEGEHCRAAGGSALPADLDPADAGYVYRLFGGVLKRRPKPVPPERPLR